MNRTMWVARNAGFLRGRWRTSYTCVTCGHRLDDTDPSWKSLIDQHELAHAGHDTLDDGDAA